MLRELAAPVRHIDDIARAQIARMKRSLEQAEGAGLAGTQVGFMRRVFVFRDSLEQPVEALVNPRVEAASAEHGLFLEGCLSYQQVAVAVERPVAVRVSAQTLDGRGRVLEAEGLRASLLQHEIDHLDGILTLDRAAPHERRRAIAILMDEARGSRPGAQRAA